MWDGYVVTKLDRWVCSGYSGFLPYEDHRNANIGANEHDKVEKNPNDHTEPTNVERLKKREKKLNRSIQILHMICLLEK